MPLLGPRRVLTPDGDERLRNTRIRVRRFAGPAAYVGALSHLRIAHLTDLHVGRVTPYHVQRHAVALANGERPDLVVITGDFVCHSQLYLDQLTVAHAGVHRAGDRRAGQPRLLGRGGRGPAGAPARRGRGARQPAHDLDLAPSAAAGASVSTTPTPVTPGARRRSRACAAIYQRSGLSHIAEEADGLWRHDVPLVLSGHTHGGQVTFARLHELAVGRIAGHKYVHGLYGSRAARDPALPQPHGAVYVGAGHRGGGDAAAHRRARPA